MMGKGKGAGDDRECGSQKPDAEEKSRTPEDRRLDCAGVSEITEADLQCLHEDGVIGSNWWVPRSEERSIAGKHVGSIMALYAWFEAGLCVPIHPFIPTLMKAYGFDLVHLHPRSVLRLNVFRWLCETVLHEPPSLPMFHYFFEVVLRPGKIDTVFGSVIVSFRMSDNKGDLENMMHHYPISPCPLKDDPWANIKKKWFYLPLTDPFYHTRILPNTGEPPHPSLRKVKVEETTPKEDEKNLKLMQARSKRSVRDFLEEMFMAGCFRMKNYSAKHLGLCSSIIPPEHMKPMMTCEETKRRVDKLIDPYTEEEHRLYLADIGDFENHNIVTKCFKMSLPPRVAPCLGPQLVLPDGRSARLATGSREPAGSSKRDNVGAVLKPVIVLGMKAKDSSVPCVKHQRKKKAPLPDLDPEAVEPCKANRKRKRKKIASLSASPPLEDDGCTLPEEAQQESVGKAISGDLPLAKVPPSTSQEKVAMDMWVQAKLRDVLGNDDETEVLPHSPLLLDYEMDYGSKNEEEGALDQREKNDRAVALPSPLPFSGSDTGNTTEWLDSLVGMDEAESGAARVVQEVQNLVRVAGYAPRLKKKSKSLKKRGTADRKALLAVRGPCSLIRKNRNLP